MLAPAEMNTYLNMLKRDGVMVLVGAPAEALPIHPFSLLMKRRTLAGDHLARSTRDSGDA